MRAFSLAALAVTASLAGAAPASAALVVATYTGTATGADDLGVFGGGMFTDAAFTAVIQYDTTQGTRTTTAFGDSLAASGTNPFIEASLTIGGTTYTWAPVTSGSASVSFGSGQHQIIVDNVDVQPFGDLYTTFSRHLELVTFPVPGLSSIDSYANYSDADPGLWSNARFAATTITNPQTQEYTQTVSQFSLTASNVSVEVNGAIPEPSTWALMIVGFGSAGAMLRRRQLATSATR